MDVILIGLGLVVVALMGATLMLLPHLVEGIVHVHAPEWVARLPSLNVGLRALPPPLAEPRAVADGYRSTRQLEAPALRVGTWTRGLPDGTGDVRIEVRDAHTALVTVPAKRRRLVGHIVRANGTLRIRLVESEAARRLEARAVPACFALPFAPAMYGLFMMVVGGQLRMGDVVTGTLAPILVLFALWVPTWWAVHTERLHAAAELAMEELEAQLGDTRDRQS